MTTSTSSNLTRYLRQMLRTWEHDERPDAELLALYVRDRDDQAFATLVRRYSVLVWSVSYRILGHREEAEDTFQATFLLLARKAAEISHKELVGHWLYGVAQRTARDMRKSLARRHRHEKQASTMVPTTYTDDVDRPELLAVLDEEIVRLPAAYRLPLILCCLEGQTYAEAAQLLGCSTAAVGRRVVRAEELLRDRLIRRGVALTGASVAALLSQAVTAKEMSVCLVGNTIRTVQSFVRDDLAPSVAVSIAQGVMSSMGSKAVLWGSVFVTLVGVTVGLVTQLAPQAQGVVSVAASAAPATPAEEPQRDRYGDPLPPGALARLGTVRWRHTTGLIRLAFTRDGKGLITAGWGNPTRLWDVTTGRMLRQFGDSWGGEAWSAAFSPDGRIVTGKERATDDLCLWDVARGTLLRKLKGGQARGYAPLAFSPDGTTMATSDSVTLTLRLWEVATGKEWWVVKPIKNDSQGVISYLTYSADGKTLIWAGGSGGELHFLDVATGKELRRWDDDKKRCIGALTCSRDGRLFATYGRVQGAGSYLARLWDMATGKEVWRQLSDEEMGTVATFSPDGKILAIGYFQGPIRLLDAATGKELRRYTGCRGTALDLAFSPDGKMLASGGGGGIGGSQDQMVHLWDVESGREVRRADDGHQATVCSVAFTPDGKDIVSSGWEGSIRMWDAVTGEQRRQVLPASDEHFVGSTTVSITSAVSSDGKTILSATWNEIRSKLKSSVKFRQWDRDTTRELRGWSQELGNKALCSIAFSPDGKTVACTNLKVTPDPNQVYLWEAATGRELHRIAGSYPAFSPDSKILATAPWHEQAQGNKDEPGSFTLWETATAKKLCSVSLPMGRVHRLLFSPDGRMLATASNSNVARNQPSVIYLWPLSRDESRKSAMQVGSPRVLATYIPPLLLDFGDPMHWFGAWAFSPDGRTLAISRERGKVWLLETASGKERGCFAGHDGDVAALSFAPDGRRLASGSRDTTILVWDVTGRLQGGRLRAAPLSAKELEKLWADLASDDARQAGHVIWTLVAAPDQAVPYLGERLQTSAVNAKAQMAKLSQFIRDLDADAFVVRQKARTELARLGVAAESALRRALAKSPSLEMRRSLEQLLKALEQGDCMLSGELLRGVRTLEVLEHIGSREARQALKALTTDAGVESLLTQEARAALKRLDRAERR